MHSGKGIAIAFAIALFLNFSVKSLSRKVVQKFWGEVSVLSLPLMLIIMDVIVHTDWAEHRLLMIGLGEDLIVHVDWAKHGLILIDLGENVQVHVDTT